jgi:hypothetical protein
MKDFGSAFLGLILAGVLMMVIGIGLLMSSARSPISWVVFAEKRTSESTPANPASSDRTPAASIR